MPNDEQKWNRKNHLDWLNVSRILEFYLCRIIAAKWTMGNILWDLLFLRHETEKGLEVVLHMWLLFLREESTKYCERKSEKVKI